MKLQKQNIALFLVSFTILFIEVALIRWVSTDIRIFSYLSNFVLLACFLGIGLGCYLSQKKIHLFITPLMLFLLIIFIRMPLKINISGQTLHLFSDIPIFLASFKGSVIHYQKTIAHLPAMQFVGVLATLTLFFVILLSLFPLGQVLGRIFDEYKNTVKAYSINIVASLLGLWAFSGLSFIYSPPWMWLLISVLLVGVLMICLKSFSKWNIFALLICLVSIVLMIFMLSKVSTEGITIWSPYQKLTLRPIKPYPTGIDPFKTKSIAGYTIDVNNVGYMNLLNLSDSFREKYAVYFKKQFIYRGEREGVLNALNFPFVLKDDARSVLILGAGAGDDVAGALRNGLTSVDAVEIDPGIYKLGLKYHPEDPYSDPRVRVFIDDARSFFKKSKEKYDVIFYGLLDAHAQSSNLNNMRMDHYVYTQESFEEAKELLKDDGVMIVSFWVQRRWIGVKIRHIIREVFGYNPPVISFSDKKDGLDRIMIIASHEKEYAYRLLLENNPEIRQFFMTHAINFDVDIKTTTDDWPYLYLRRPMIPEMHLCFIGIIIFLFFLSKSFLLKKGNRLDFHFFFLGAAFLLLEFQNINKTALLFGSTWIVNSINISAILIFILLANLFVSLRKVRNLKIPYFLLLISLLFIFFVPLRVYNVLGYWQKSILASLVLNLPIFFAGIIFIVSFKNSKHKNLSFGSNLIGAVAGGLLESLSFILGIRMLVLVTIGLYFLSFVFFKNKT